MKDEKGFRVGFLFLCGWKKTLHSNKLHSALMRSARKNSDLVFKGWQMHYNNMQ